MNKRKNSAVTIIVLLILALVAWGLKQCRKSGDNPPRTETTIPGDWRNHKLIYTKHARCRMDCREISETEVEFVLSNGIINEEKSRELDAEAKGSCPTFALEAETQDGQKVRIVFGACEKITKVITVIDLGKENVCNCR